MRVRGCRVRVMGWSPCHAALGKVTSPSYVLICCRALCVPRLVLCELARRVVDCAAAIGVVNLDLLIESAVA